MRSALVVIEVMASVILLVWAGLLIHALHRLDTTDPGVRPEGVLTVRTALPRPKYNEASAREAFYRGVLDEVRRLPGVRHAAYLSFAPMTFGGGIWPVGVPGRPPALASGRVASLRFATPDSFAALGIPLLRGRDILESDTMSQPLVAVVSESFARQYFPGEDPIGKRFDFAAEIWTIAGVVGDVRVRGPEQDSEPQVYLPYRQIDDLSYPFYTPKDLVIRSSVPASSLVPEIRRIVRAIDPAQPISNVQTMADIIARQTESRTVQVRVLGAFAALALLLAAVGIHGLLAFTVSQRTHEIGVRIALGAEPARLVRGVIVQSGRLAAAGLIPGVAVAYAGGRAMESLLAGVTPADATTFGGAAVLCGLVTLAGSVTPALRAARVPPAMVFRGD
jgi:predicted permease